VEQAGAELSDIYGELFDRYGPQGWWPASEPYEVVVGAVLTQNTAWTNVERAIARFGNELTPKRVLSLTHEELTSIIAPAGYYNSKARCLVRVTEWYQRQAAGGLKIAQLEEKRQELLSLKGVGPETADSILLYAFGLPVFVVDAYTRRLMERLGFDVPKQYERIRKAFERTLPKDAALYNEYHALIVTHCKRHCRKKPLCEGCVLQARCSCRHCDRAG